MRRPGQIDQERRHQRQNAWRQEADEPPEQGGEEGHVRRHGPVDGPGRPPGASSPGLHRADVIATVHRRCAAGTVCRAAPPPIATTTTATDPATDHTLPNESDEMRNLITDVAGLKVGQRRRCGLASGSTAIVFDRPATVAVDVRGGAPATRETDLLAPHRTVAAIDAVVLSGGSAFGLDAAAGLQAWLREQGRGFAIGDIERADRLRRLAVRPYQRRRQGLGPLPALSRTRLCRGRRRPALDFALGTAGAGFGAHRLRSQGRPRLRLRRHPRGPHRGRARRGQCLREGHDRRQPPFLGGAVRTGRRVRRTGLPGRVPPEALVPARQRPRRARTRPSPSSRPMPRWTRPRRTRSR